MNDNKTWGIADAWSTAFAAQPARELSPRNYIYATELGKAPVEVWLRMHAVAPTNPPNDRAKMKMEAGKVVEGIVKFVFMRAGILKEHQVEANTTVEGVEIHGRLDFIAGGKPDLAQGMEAVKMLDMIDESLGRAGKAVIEYMVEHFPEGLPEQPFEVKSIGTFGMDAMENSRRAIKIHRYQTEHYLFTKNFQSAELSYICRDDFRMIEHAISASPESKKEYMDAVLELKPWITSETQPPNAPMLIFDTEAGKFSKNLDVSWSSYLTLIYGFKTPREYDEPYGKMATNWNRVLKRLKNGD
ncbi:MAG: hypothetical protein KGJ13_12695, partial [Patescibacteria group bacterium]|nr:hypothetical protein [Patescibacteria group bacterium]